MDHLTLPTEGQRSKDFSLESGDGGAFSAKAHASQDLAVETKHGTVFSKRTYRGRAYSAGDETAEETAKMKHKRVLSDGGRRKPLPLCLGGPKAEEHILECQKPIRCQSLNQDILHNLQSEDPFTTLVAIYKALQTMLASDRQATFLSVIGQALDKLPLDMHRIFAGLPLPLVDHSSAISAVRSIMPCMYLGQPEALLSSIRSYLYLSSRHVFPLFLTKFFHPDGTPIIPPPPEFATEEPLSRAEVEASGGIFEPTDLIEYFHLRVLSATADASFIDGWHEDKIEEEFRTVWNRLYEEQKSGVWALVKQDPGLPPRRAILDIMKETP